MQRKRGWLKKAILICVVLVLVGWSVYSALTPQQRGTQSMSSSSAAKSLEPNDFQIEVLSNNLVFNSSTSVYSLRVDFQVTNNLNLQVQYINATVIFVNYTLTNGAVFQPPPLEARRVITKANFGITYPISLTFTLGIPGSNANLKDVKLLFIVYVAELSAPLYLSEDLTLTS